MLDLLGGGRLRTATCAPQNGGGLFGFRPPNSSSVGRRVCPYCILKISLCRLRRSVLLILQTQCIALFKVDHFSWYNVCPRIVFTEMHSWIRSFVIQQLAAIVLSQNYSHLSAIFRNNSQGECPKIIFLVFFIDSSQFVAVLYYYGFQHCDTY